MRRETLPNRRLAINMRIRAGTTQMVMGVGFFPDGRPAEVFVSDIKAGSDMDAVARDAAILLSIALQHGIPLPEIAKSLTQDPGGTPSSVIGSLVKELLKGNPTSS